MSAAGDKLPEKSPKFLKTWLKTVFILRLMVGKHWVFAEAWRPAAVLVGAACAR
jgi:hypothetical protein